MVTKGSRFYKNTFLQKGVHNFCITKSCWLKMITDIAELLSAHSTKFGLEIYRCTDFSNIVDEFEKENPHLVLLDVNLPFYDGFYWCAQNYGEYPLAQYYSYLLIIQILIKYLQYQVALMTILQSPLLLRSLLQKSCTT